MSNKIEMLPNHVVISRDRDIDGGWAWLVMIASYLTILIGTTELYMSGVIYRTLLDKFHEGEAKTSLVGAIDYGLLCVAAPFGGAIVNKFSCRFAIVSGAILTTTGCVLSAFMSSLDWMILSAGVCIGLGNSVTTAGVVCGLGYYFKKHRERAISCAYAVVGLAMFISVPFGLHIITTYGLSHAYLILACIHAQVCVLGMICKPSSIEQGVQAKKKIDRKENSYSISKSYMDMSLLKEKAIMCFLVSTLAWNFALAVAVMHLPNYVFVLGGTNNDIGLLMTAFAVANLIGRISGLMVITRFNQKSLHVHFVCLCITGIITSTFPLYSHASVGTYIFTIQLGVLCGVPNTMMTPISIRFVGVAKISEAHGLAYLFCGLGGCSGPVIIGFLYDKTGSYGMSFLVAGMVLILGSLSSLVSLCIRKPTSINDVMELSVEECEGYPLQNTNNAEMKFDFHEKT